MRVFARSLLEAAGAGAGADILQLESATRALALVLWDRGARLSGDLVALVD